MGFLDGFRAGLEGKAGDGLAGVVKALDGSGTTGVGQTIGGGILNATTAGGFQRGSVELLAAYQQSPHVRKVVGTIANQLAAIEYHLVKTKGKSRKSMKSLASGAARGKFETIYDHPFLDFLWNGSLLMDAFSATKLSWVYFLLKGESFRWMLPGPDGKAAWIVLPPQWVKECPVLGGRTSFKIQLGAKAVDVPEEFVLWLKDPSVLDPHGRGAGIGDALRDELDTDEYAANLLRTTMANKGLIEGILSAKGDLSDASKRSLKRKFEEGFRGGSSSGRIAVLSDEVKYTQLTHAFGELRLLELREAEKTIIEETFCLPPELFGKVTGSNRATIYEASNIFARNTLVPFSTLEAGALTNQWLPHFEKRGDHWVWFEDPTPADLEMRRQLMAQSPESFTANEIREAGGLQPVQWGEVRYVAGNKFELPVSGSGGQGAKAVADEATDQKKSPVTY